MSSVTAACAGSKDAASGRIRKPSSGDAAESDVVCIPGAVLQVTLTADVDVKLDEPCLSLRSMLSAAALVCGEIVTAVLRFVAGWNCVSKPTASNSSIAPRTDTI